MNNFLIVSSTVSVVLLIIFSQITEINSNNNENNSSFECGFNTISPQNISFSTNFLILTIIFLIFDVEISILIPFVTISNNTQNNIVILSMLFITILVLLIINEWNQGSLDWNH